MVVIKSESLQIRLEQDVVAARQLVYRWAVECKFSLLETTKVVTATSELARNTIIHGLGGTMIVERLSDGSRVGLRMTFQDLGPGILDLQLALTPGNSTGKGMGLGLSGAKNLSSEFEIVSNVGQGTLVRITRWK